MPEQALRYAVDYCKFGEHQARYHWGNFSSWCNDENVSLDHPDDWYNWWKCWMHGAEAESSRY